MHHQPTKRGHLLAMERPRVVQRSGASILHVYDSVLLQDSNGSKCKDVCRVSILQTTVGRRQRGAMAVLVVGEGYCSLHTITHPPLPPLPACTLVGWVGTALGWVRTQGIAAQPKSGALVFGQDFAALPEIRSHDCCIESSISTYDPITCLSGGCPHSDRCGHEHGHAHEPHHGRSGHTTPTQPGSVTKTGSTRLRHRTVLASVPGCARNPTF
jgi:hypothetical protein